MGSSIDCYFVAPTGRAAIALRRHLSPPDGGTVLCPAHPTWNSHWSSKRIGDVACELRPSETDGRSVWWIDYPDQKPSPEDPRWPTVCDCGFVFPADAARYLDRWPLYAGVPGAEQSRLRDQPPGAMWRADWLEETALPAGTQSGGAHNTRLGPEGWCVSVMTPDGEWSIDTTSSNSGFWTRDSLPTDIKAGDRITITASPSILMRRYHGWLRGGVLVEC